MFNRGLCLSTQIVLIEVRGNRGHAKGGILVFVGFEYAENILVYKQNLERMLTRYNRIHTVL